jgi:hypothetical protein
MSGTWIETARATLLQLRDASAGWGQRVGSAPHVEPTVLACLGLLASGRAPGTATPPAEVRAAADWLASLQARNGSLGVSAALSAPGWTTAHGLLLWAALGGYTAQRERAARWLLDQKGVATPLLPPSERIVGHDTTLVGWPWVDDTHSWLEPTAWAVLALRRDGRADHPRVREGLRLIRDRAIADGGWNYGNNSVFGRALRPQPGPTGLALLALAGVDGPTEAAARALRYLQAVLPGTRAAESLCWGVLALRAWGCRPEAADGWLAGACDQALRRPDPAPRLAYLLLAAGDHALELLEPALEKGTRHAG